MWFAGVVGVVGGVVVGVPGVCVAVVVVVVDVSLHRACVTIGVVCCAALW